MLITKIDGIAISNSNNYFSLPMGDFNASVSWALRFQLTDSTNTIDVITENSNFANAWFNIYYIYKVWKRKVGN